MLDTRITAVVVLPTVHVFFNANRSSSTAAAQNLIWTRVRFDSACVGQNTQHDRVSYEKMTFNRLSLKVFEEGLISFTEISENCCSIRRKVTGCFGAVNPYCYVTKSSWQQHFPDVAVTLCYTNTLPRFAG